VYGCAMDPPILAGVTHRYVQARGARLHYAEAGSGEDVVLLLHGWPQHWWEWREVIPALAGERRVIALDLRGFGWSQATPRGYLKEELASDVLAVLDALGIERVTLVGHDWGGFVGFLCCLRAPERFEGFFALNIIGPWVGVGTGVRNTWRFGYQWLLAAPLLGSLAQRSGWLTRLLLVGGVARRGSWRREDRELFVARLRPRARAAAGVQLYRTFWMRELVPMLRGRYDGQRLRVPTKMLHGSSDPVVTREMVERVRMHADELEIEYVDGVSHFIVDEAPALVIERLLAFVARPAPSTAA
jgi:pimeloyl-ACP methyl ester carboxylesterase